VLQADIIALIFLKIKYTFSHARIIYGLQKIQAGKGPSNVVN
jgi:hypothetical protein